MANMGRIWLLAGGLLGVAVIALGWLLGASPLFAQADQSDAQRAGVESQNRQYEATLANMKALDERKDELVEDYDLIKASVPPVLDLEGYFDWIATAANTSGVSLTTAAADAVQPYQESDPRVGTVPLDPGFQKTLGLVPVRLQIGGNAEQVANFLHMLQTDGRLQLITRANVQLGTTLTSQLDGYLFVITDPKLAALSQSIGGSGSAGEGTEAGDGESTEEPTPEATPTPPSDVETPSARG